jgi:hypothetical protein
MQPTGRRRRRRSGSGGKPGRPSRHQVNRSAKPFFRTQFLVTVGDTYRPAIRPEIVFIDCTAEAANGYADAKSAEPAQSQPQQQQQEQPPPQQQQQQQQQQHVFDPADPIYQAMMAAAQTPAKPAVQVGLTTVLHVHACTWIPHSSFPVALLFVSLHISCLRQFAT